MTLDELIDRTPAQFRPIVARYGPALIQMTAEEFLAWVELLIAGETREAWDTIVRRLDNPGLQASWESLQDKWHEANRRNAARLKLQRDAIVAILKVLLGVALAAAGL
jgi:hypothetical protein